MIRLLEKDHAYKSDGSIYYRISSFPEYGKLSKINFAGNIVGGSERIDTDKYEKEDARDFALWKESRNPVVSLGWEASIGRGRPGWHIECSAMSMKYLGETFDIHAGGIDCFPAPRERDRAKRRRERESNCPLLDSLRTSESRRRNDVEVEGKLLHVSRHHRQRLFTGSLFAIFC